MSAATHGRAELRVAGTVYGGWKTVSATCSIEQVANGFELGVTERWPGQTASRPIRPGDACELLLDGETVVTGYVDDAKPAFGKQAHALTVQGRDATGDLVDCSAIHKSGQWINATLERIARDLCAPFGIKVKVEADVGAAFTSFNIEQGETVFDCLERAARQRAVLLIADGVGGLVLARAGTARAATALVEGESILEGNGQFDWKDRYSTITAKGQERSDDDFNGTAAAGPSATVRDAEITRHRPLIVLAEAHGAGASLRARVTWERNVRMGRGTRATVTVQGWRDGAGKLWRPNTLVPVHAPSLWLADTELLIAACLYSLDDDGGTRTTLSLARREAFDVIADGGKSKKGKSLLWDAQS